MIRRILAISALLATAGPAQAGITEGAWHSTRSSLTYKVVHKFHEIEGKSAAAEARALVREGKLQVQVRLPAGSFESGNSNRDSNVKAVIETAKFPTITLKGVSPICAEDTGCTLQLQATVEFHGQSRPYSIPVKVTALANGHVEAAFHLDMILTEHKIELPRLMFIPIDDKMTVDGTIEMEHGA